MKWLIDIVKEWLQRYLKGMIVIWSGAIVDIPDGWALCDGTNGTPNLSGKFVRAPAPPFLNVGDSGGAASHSHSFTTDGHFHTLGMPGIIAPGANFTAYTDTKTDTGNTDVKDNLPPYYILAFIMKL